MNRIMRTASYMTKKRTRPFDYPAGTRVTTASFALTSGVADLNLAYIGSATTTALLGWQVAHERDLDLEEMFITVSFTAAELHVEVSDRMRQEES